MEYLRIPFIQRVEIPHGAMWKKHGGFPTGEYFTIDSLSNNYDN